MARYAFAIYPPAPGTLITAEEIEQVVVKKVKKVKKAAVKKEAAPANES
jgi:hypothetical protein